ncbi:reverse transcriptase family protein [Burkholderia sp. 22PA0106]|uniref:reverse transcriptase family protein n=1 Tax=Burkholderia sp. 22PA0106 TaxID=3237371 RepID=UPI0039C2EBF2
MRPGIPKTIALLCEAMLAGDPEPAAVAARLVLACDRHEGWMDAIARIAVERFARVWRDTEPDELASLFELEAPFPPGWSVRDLPAIVRIQRRAPEQRLPPPRLVHLDLPSLPTLRELADWLELSDEDLAWLATRWRVAPNEAASPLHHYRYHAREKPDGRHRLIEQPKPQLRVAQYKLLHGLFDRVPPHEAVHGFRRGRNIVSFAAPHAGQPLVIRLDFEDFFGSVTEARVHGLFRTLGYPVAVAQALSALATNRVPSRLFDVSGLKGKFDWHAQQRLRTRHLPQGAATSPALANLCAFRLDLRLAALARGFGATYTRYADDLAFSGGDRLKRVARDWPLWVARIAEDEGFTVRPQKTRVLRDNMRQQLAGVVVNRHPNLPRQRFDLLKATLTNCVRHGPTSQNRDGRTDFRASLAGHVAHATMLNAARGAKLKAIFDQIDWTRG